MTWIFLNVGTSFCFCGPDCFKSCLPDSLFHLFHPREGKSYLALFNSPSVSRRKKDSTTRGKVSVSTRWQSDWHLYSCVVHFWQERHQWMVLFLLANRLFSMVSKCLRSFLFRLLLPLWHQGPVLSFNFDLWYQHIFTHLVNILPYFQTALSKPLKWSWVKKMRRVSTVHLIRVHLTYLKPWRGWRVVTVVSDEPQIHWNSLQQLRQSSNEDDLQHTETRRLQQPTRLYSRLVPQLCFE